MERQQCALEKMERMNINLPKKEFWKNKKVLITGHTGFKGSWLSLYLKELGAEVHGISLRPKNKINLFDQLGLDKLIESNFINIKNKKLISKKISEINPDILFHLAAQPLVIESYKKTLETFETNIQGTINVIEAIKKLKKCKISIIVTSDKVYKNKETLVPYKETDQLGGHDPYSASKAAVEIITNSYRESFFNCDNRFIATVRAGNVIGGGDWSKNRIIPDAVKSWNKSEILNLRNADSIRPWQHVLDPLTGYILLAQKTIENGNLSGSYNFGPNTNELVTVEKLIKLSSKYFNNAKYRIKKNKNTLLHETNLLNLDNSKSKKELGYHPIWDVNLSIKYTMNWYKDFYENKNALNLCMRDLNNFLLKI